MNKPAIHLTQVAALLSTAMLSGCGGSAKTSTDLTKVDPAQPVSSWQMVWNDEFETSNIDTKKWSHEINCDGGGNNEAQCYTDNDENSFIADGILNIVAKPAEDGSAKPYTSARLNSRYKADFKYGRFEISAKLPSGQGSWPAFWMMPTDEVYGGWPRSGEIDIVEAVNLKAATAEGGTESNVHGTLHYGREWPNNASSGKSYQLPDSINPADDFHTYAIEWQEGEIRWYVDNYLYATQRKSTVRYNSKDEAVGLAHKGWFTEYFDQTSGELKTYWTDAPYDQKFYMILNFAVGGNWPENVNELGIDASAFENGQTFAIDYVRVYECSIDVNTGKGCETVRAGYDKLDDALVEGAAPVPAPPSTGIAQNLTIFDGAVNPNWPAWDCCGGSTPSVVNDAEKGDVMRFTVGEQPTVNGFISRGEFITDPEGKASPFDASPIIDNGSISFAVKVVSAPSNPDSTWLMKVESIGGATAIEIPLSTSTEASTPITGQWQTYTFPLQALADLGLDISSIDVIMIFPAWGTGSGAEYLVDDVQISQPVSSPKLVLFENEVNPDWPLWDCCGGSTPTEEMDDAEHGLVAEFVIGAQPTVMGFITRSANGGADKPFDASAIIDNGVLQFDLKVVNAPSNPDSTWLIKLESDNGATAVEWPITNSVEGVIPVSGQWQTHSFKVSELAAAGLDISAIDVIMIFPAWGTGEGAVYRVDNAKILDPDANATSGLTLFKDTVANQWSIWDCCGGSTPTEEQDDDAHGMVAEYKIGAQPTVMGFFAQDGIYHDASADLATGVVRFEMKVVDAPSNPDAVWTFKIESGDASTAVELPLAASSEGEAVKNGVWQTYTFTLQSLYDAGLDISAIDVVMVFPSWGAGEGAVYRIDNAIIATP
ncbi:glycoside hydrolase family 16 protein [Pseudoalteromonas ulvae]|uniref:Glycosyl hydrolase family 16 n=1 Tax=Pseudoalteromonas ulvae TaxID=107327 RepID=A0A244CMX7_PSEDV|nr:glycoside hydrolase family 16 protein [Pseudoalteromonas ulvae]OUL56908.1 glycosyl hydrolase family 16 [Pseudoalteromonas ulvae]